MKHLWRTVTEQLFLRSRIFYGVDGREMLMRKLCNDVSEKLTNRSKFETFIPFSQMVELKHEEANRSIIVQVKEKKSYEDLITYCQSFGNVKNSIYYSTFGNDLLKHFVLIEYEYASDTEAALNCSKPTNLDQVLPVSTSFLWFCAGVKRPQLVSIPTLHVPPNKLPTPDELEKLFQKSNSFDEDVMVLYNHTKLNDIGTRLRFITALQLEKAFSGLFSMCRVLPFGSSINSFGKLNCDLDLVLQLYAVPSPPDSRLIYTSKALRGTSRLHSQRHMETIADILQVFLPGCTNTRRILKARVPIIKFTHDITELECDLSSSNLSGVYMSELLYLYGAYDWRVRPFVFAVRHWAQAISLTNPTPGKWVTNFMLTLLVLFHLQHEKIIPTLETLSTRRRPEDEKMFIDENGEEIHCGFLSDLNFIENAETVANDSNLLELLFSFFQFYSVFDFRCNALSLHSGNVIPKPFYDAMYIVNPLEKGLNVSRNVSQEECDKFQMMVRTGAWSIECAINAAVKDRKKWSLNDLITSYMMNKSGFPRTRSMKGIAKFTVKELFNSEDTTSDIARNMKDVKV